jgi:3-phosphoshikimate 1-carboxyvinyltransferase
MVEHMGDRIHINKLDNKGPWAVRVPGSKSITNRALMLAAMSQCECEIRGVLFSQDSRAFLDCLEKLGFDMEVDEARCTVRIKGTGGRIPNQCATVNVQSAGTAARFLTVLLAFAGGDYELHSSEQMSKRPMEPLLSILSGAGVRFEFLGSEGHFPFRLHSDGVDIGEVTVDTTVSSQFTSALLMAGVLLPAGLTVRVTGSRQAGSYILMTLSMMEQLGISVSRGDGVYSVAGGTAYGGGSYLVEPDVSGASYFYALAPIFGTNVKVYDVHRPSLQGDMRFVELLGKLGCRLEDEPDGLVVRGEGMSGYGGITVDMNDYSDQVMTMAAVAVYADSPTSILNVAHIRQQESDRLQATVNELTRMGIECAINETGDGLRIIPGTPKPCVVQTYNDHRVAMSMTIAALKAGNIDIDNPMCCSKTFENFYDIINGLYVN